MSLNRIFFTAAVFEGKTIPCISLEGQLIFLFGYEQRAKDRRDISVPEDIEKTMRQEKSHFPG